MNEISTIADIQKLVLQGCQDWKRFGEVSVKEQGDLLLFNYTAAAQFAGRWNYFETVSRGLIINARTGEIVARPFDKFFNWMEGGRFSLADIVSVTEKVDGSLGILYRDNGQFKIATRGSFDGEQALWATGFLNERVGLSGIPDEMTLLFEIVYPDNRIVVNYGDREDLVLLAIRNRFTGEYYPWSKIKAIASFHGFGLPYVFRFDNAAQILNAAKSLDGNVEGWVVEFADGQRFKFKGDRYLELHRLISGLSYKSALKAVEDDTVAQLLEVLPDEFHPQVNIWLDQIGDSIRGIEISCINAFQDAPKGTRKEFALWVMENHKSLAHFLFAALDGKSIRPLIFKKLAESEQDKVTKG